MVFKVFVWVDKMVVYVLEYKFDVVVLIDSLGFMDRIGVWFRKKGYLGVIIKYVVF